MWDRPDADWRLERTYSLIHELQPQALIGSNHHMTPFPGEDFQMFEKDLPGANTAGFNTTEISQ
ncbi:MAG: alpha-L-fucosidase, partial [Gemmatimonadetes bacterium]|nr:alpha-L-fucosidase [Gemmatimonadota bacterium]NIS02945.1 alpha-L-fucosidase [Gemmatimonadota bacterium]NIT67730.1 alpha-L-fucosidase [Gemmatimonadota bacterium]NIU51630.1 alpha-L-fucosidase [Gemmatimonadota bacterium]NIV25344.1 alpha-L-fucosidase [Gemmatimonadota bacterium]